MTGSAVRTGTTKSTASRERTTSTLRTAATMSMAVLAPTESSHGTDSATGSTEAAREALTSARPTGGLSTRRSIVGMALTREAVSEAKPRGGATRRKKRNARWPENVERVQLLVVTLSAALGLPAAAYGVYKLVHHEPAPIRLSVRVQNDPRGNLSWQTAHGRLHPADGKTADKSANGYVYSVPIGMTGLGGKSATLSWAVQDQNGRPLPVPSWTPRSVRIPAASNSYNTTEEIWVSVPLRGDSWKVVFTLRYRSTQEQAQSQTTEVFESGG